MFLIRHSAWLVLGFALLAGSARDLGAQQKDKPQPLEFWHVGDDAVSQKLADAVYAALAAAPEFTPSSGKQKGSLLVEIPANVRASQVGRRTKVTYTVSFSRADDQRISSSEGSCWEQQLSVCAAQIVKRAKIAAREAK